LREGWKKMPRIKSSRNKRDRSGIGMPRIKSSGKERDGSGRGMPRIKSSRNKRDERWGKMYNCCIVILM